MKKHIVIFVLAALAAAASLRAQNTSTNDGPVVAHVGNTAISRRELTMAITGLLMQLQQQGRTISTNERQRLEYDMLNYLVDREIVLQFAKANPPADLDGKVKVQLERLRAGAGGEEPFLKQLQRAGVTREEFERRTRENILVAEALRQVAESKTKIPPEDVKAFYESNAARFKQPEMVRASQIFVRVESTASEDIKKVCRNKINAARSLVLGGEKFADIARKVSDDAQTARNGGDLGFFPRGRVIPELESTAFQLATNQVSEVIATQFGYHVLMTTDRKPEKHFSFDEVKTYIENDLRMRRSGDVLRQYVKELRDKTKVEILLPPPPAPATNAPPAAATNAPPPVAAPPKP